MLEAGEVIQQSKQITAGIMFHEVGRSLLREDGIIAAKAVAHSISWLSRAIRSLQAHALRNRMVIAPIGHGLEETGLPVTAQPEAGARQDNAQERHQRVRRSGIWTRFAITPPSGLSVPSLGRERPRLCKMSRSDTFVHAAPAPLIYAAVGGAGAVSPARAISASQRYAMRRSNRANLVTPLLPMLPPQRQNEATQPANMAVHDIAGDKSWRQTHDWTRAAIQLTRSRTSSMVHTSLAPVRTSGQSLTPALPRQEHNSEATESMPVSQARTMFDEWQLSRAISDRFERIAMRPGSGMTGYDPRVSPSFPGAPNDV